jgi:hypothetical protein
MTLRLKVVKNNSKIAILVKIRDTYSVVMIQKYFVSVILAERFNEPANVQTKPRPNLIKLLGAYLGV